ncbi:hypothetical protein [Streptomyces sp. 11-1-2]|uniref:hypothetical protein n=1 Tax=unclassified Streptomyces TaxID=2593676 RepID=UPI001F089377|nr:hypothetical protein [Streptomyces sp. 11-1-2]
MERQLGEKRVRFAPSDRAYLAALLYRLPRDVLRRLRLVVHPDTVLRWHRTLVARRHAAASRPKLRGPPVRVGGHRARQPTYPDPGRDRAPHRASASAASSTNTDMSHDLGG